MINKALAFMADICGLKAEDRVFDYMSPWENVKQS